MVLSRTGQNRVVGGVRIRRTARPYRSQVQSLGARYELTPVVAVARAVADAALEYRDLGSVRAPVAEAIQHRRCGITDLLAEYQAGPRNRSRFLRLALCDLRDGARSAAEATAARRLARGDVPPFELNVPVVNERGVLLFVLDVLWRELRAGLEIDSREHHFDEQEWEDTMRRHNKLTRYGLSITHYAPRLVTARDDGFVAEVAERLRGRARELGVSVPPGHGVRRPALDATPAPFVIPVGA